MEGDWAWMSKGGYHGDHLRDYLPHDPSHQALYNKGALLTTMQAPKLGNQIDTNLRPIQVLPVIVVFVLYGKRI